MPRFTRPLRPMLIVLLTLLTVGLVPWPADADTRTISCSPSRRLANALRLPAGRDLVIRITGVCNENIVIDRDDVTLVAASAGAEIHGTDAALNTILIDGAKGVMIQGLIVSGQRNGIVGINGAEFTVDHATVQNNKQGGIVALFNSTVMVQSSTVRNNGQTGDKELNVSGISISDNSAGTVINSTVTGNGHTETIPGLEEVRQPGRFGSGIVVNNGSAARIGRTVAGVEGPNTITGNAANGVSVLRASQGQVWMNTITGNGGSGVSIDGGSATIVLSDISTNGGSGISVANAGGARIGYDDVNIAMFRTDCNCTNRIVGNGTRGLTDVRKVSPGLDISNGANATFHGSLISGNTGNGVSINNASGRAAGGNIISNNGDSGIGVGRGYFHQGQFSILQLERDHITGNGTNKRDEGSTGYGVVVTNGTASLFNFVISGNRRDGVGLFFGAQARLQSDDPNNVSVIENNGTAANDGTPGTGTGPAPSSSTGSGINAFDGSTVEVRGVIVRNNKVHGIGLSDGAKASLRANVLTFGAVCAAPMTASCYDATIPTEVYGNANHGISVFNGSSVDLSKGVVIRDNGTVIAADSTTGLCFRPTGASDAVCTGNGIAASTNSSVNVNDSTIRNNVATGISLFMNSTLQIGASSSKFPPIGSYPLGLQSFVKDNGVDGITLFSNSSLNMFATAVSTPTNNGTQQYTSVTGNKRHGLNCGTLSRVQANVTGVTGNHVSGTGADLAGSAIVTSSKTFRTMDGTSDLFVLIPSSVSSQVGAPDANGHTFLNANCQ